MRALFILIIFWAFITILLTAWAIYQGYKCERTCDSQRYRVIEEECHCATEDGWVRS